MTTLAQRLWKKITRSMDPWVFFGAAFVVVAFIVFGGVWTKTAQSVFEAAQAFIADRLGWIYALVVTGFLVFVLLLALGRFKHVRLGKDADRPEFSTLTWFAMLFGAGMGTGLVFFGVAEPITHWNASPLEAGPRSDEALLEALKLSIFHWGLHPWAIYIVLALALTLFHFRYDLPLAPRSLLHPLIGERIHGFIGRSVDVLCTVGTLIGVAASLGLGSMQINSGLERMGYLPFDLDVQLSIIASITLVATISVVSGIHHGIRRLSQLNLLLATFLCLFVLFTGPTSFLFEYLVTGLGSYLQDLPSLSLWVSPVDAEAERWQRDWTLSYWGWWLAWSPFVGVFVARISKGRTLRQFVLCVLFVPALGSAVWMAVFGGTGLAFAHGDLGMGAAVEGFAESILETPAIALHALFEQLPFASVTTVLATLLTMIFFVTSSDSGSLVDDMVTSGGHPNPPRAQRVFWAVSEGAMACALLVTDGLDALRTAAVTVGLPMAFLLCVAAFSTLRALRRREG